MTILVNGKHSLTSLLMMRFLLPVVVLGVALMVGPQVASAQLKLGVVDLEKIVTQMPEYKTIESKLRGVRQRYEDTLRMIQSTFQTRLDNYQKQQALMSQEAKAKEEAELGQLRDQYLMYEQEKLGNSGEYARVQDSLVAPLRERVAAAIEQVAREQKLSAVMNRALLVFADPKLDITYKVLDFLNRGPN